MLAGLRKGVVRRSRNASTGCTRSEAKLARSAISRYTDYRIQYLPLLFTLPIAALTDQFLPETLSHRALAGTVFAFTLGVTAGEIARAVWLRRRHRRQRLTRAYLQGVADQDVHSNRTRS